MEKQVDLADGLYILTTTVCPKCKEVKRILDGKGAKYIELSATENLELVEKLDVLQAPTIIVVEDGKAQVMEGIEASKTYAKNLS